MFPHDEFSWIDVTKFNFHSWKNGRFFLSGGKLIATMKDFQRPEPSQEE